MLGRRFDLIELVHTKGEAEAVPCVREREALLLQRSIDLLCAATEPAADPFTMVEALHITRRLWESLIADLSSRSVEEWDKRDKCLITVAGWVLKEVDSLQRGEPASAEAIVEVSKAWKDTL